MVVPHMAKVAPGSWVSMADNHTSEMVSGGTVYKYSCHVGRGSGQLPMPGGLTGMCDKLEDRASAFELPP